MADLLGIQKALEKFNESTVPALTGAVEKLIDATLPKLTEAIDRGVDSADKHIDEDLVQIVGSLNGLAQTLVDDLHGILDRLNKATVTITINIPPRK